MAFIEKLLCISIATFACKDRNPRDTIRTKRYAPRHVFLSRAVVVQRSLKRKSLYRRTGSDIARYAIRTQFNLPINALIGRAVS